MNQYDNPEFFAAYAQMSRSQFGLEGAGEWHQLKPMFPDLKGKSVLDLGCGYGWHCKYAADCIEYRVCDIHEFDYSAESYDLVVSNLVMHYIEDLQEVYRLVHKTLKPGGTFLFNIEHPTFTAGINQQFAPDGTWPVDNYYYPGERITDFLGHEVKKYHHTLTQILNGLLQLGFAIEAVEEAMPPEDAATGFIFYPGGKVEYTAYAPLMMALAEQNVLCVVVEMPFNLAVLDMSAAKGIPEQFPEIESWYIGGHSLGGSMAASFAADNAESFDGL